MATYRGRALPSPRVCRDQKTQKERGKDERGNQPGAKTVAHLYRVQASLGGGCRWVVGPKPGAEGGWVYVDDDAPQLVGKMRRQWKGG